MRYSTGAGQFVDPKTAARMQELRTQADAAKASWQALQEEAARLSAQMRSTSGNITELANRPKEVVSASRAAKAEYQSLAQQMNRISGAANTLPPMFSKISSETAKTSTSQRKLKSDIDDTSRAMERQRAAGSKGILDGFNRESRQAMSIFQRLRGEILSLATAYVGLYGVISNVGGVLQAYQKMEAAQNRLGVVFEQNQQKTGAEYLKSFSREVLLYVGEEVLSVLLIRLTFAAGGIPVDEHAALVSAGRKSFLDHGAGLFAGIHRRPRANLCQLANLAHLVWPGCNLIYAAGDVRIHVFVEAYVQGQIWVIGHPTAHVDITTEALEVLCPGLLLSVPIAL